MEGNHSLMGVGNSAVASTMTHPHKALATGLCFWLLSKAPDIKGNVRNM